MQKFTRALTREIEVGGERLAVTLSEEGLSVRVVGTRKTPYAMTWAACMCACTQGREHPPSEEEVAAAVKALRAGAKEPASGAAPAKTEEAKSNHPAEHPATHAAPPAHGHAPQEHASHQHAPKEHAPHEHAPKEHPGAS